MEVFEGKQKHGRDSCQESDNVVRLSDRVRRNDGKLHILVAAGNPASQKIRRGLLEHAGYRVTVTGSGEEALDMMDQMAGSISLAILDMDLPDLSGADTVKAWRFMECVITGTNKSRLHIVLLAADNPTKAESICSEAGADDFLTKPVDNRLLLDKIREWFGKIQPPATANVVKAKADVLRLEIRLPRTSREGET